VVSSGVTSIEDYRTFASLKSEICPGGCVHICHTPFCILAGSNENQSTSNKTRAWHRPLLAPAFSLVISVSLISTFPRISTLRQHVIPPNQHNQHVISAQ
jgi:hypothetical protein